LFAVVGLAAAALVPFAGNGALTAQAAVPHFAGNCEYAACAEVSDWRSVFGYDRYVGHDEPSLVFYSNRAGAGNRMSYDVTLPKDPSPGNPTAPGKSYSFELNGAIWLGMALCDTQSYPETVSTCTPDSDSNIANNPDPSAPDYIGNHPGTAFMEMQFYPPGWVPWPTWAQAVGASTCDPTKWCAAMNIFGLLEDPIHGTLQNDTCLAQIGSPEYWNFAFITKNGQSQAPANPVDSTLSTFTPDPKQDLFMSSGDKLRVAFSDTANGLRVAINDLSSGQSGSMTASASNGFAQVQFDPNGTSCNALPYNFHPMYATSSEDTRVIWAAHTYNVSMSDEIGHFETCSGSVPATPFGLDSSGNPVACPAGSMEENGAEATDGDDDFCFPASEALRIHVTGCTDSNTGFDGMDYTAVWPDGNTKLHPTPFLFSSPQTGRGYNINYQRVAFEADLPRIESPGPCNRSTGVGCTNPPVTDDGQPAAFYPYFSAVRGGASGDEASGCVWGFGNTLPGTINNFGMNAQYGPELNTVYLAFGGGGATINRINNFRQVLSQNPCTSGD
jgi:hypothetical protein